MEKHRKNNSMIFELLSGCSNNFFFIGNILKGNLQWTKNALALFPIEDECVNDPNIWRKLLQEKDLTIFIENCQQLCNGDIPQIMGEYHVHLSNGTQVPAHIHIWTIDQTQSEYAGIISIHASEGLIHQVNGLANYYDFRTNLSSYIQRNISCGLLSIGIDSLKRINEIHSYTLGDEVLLEIAEKIKQKLPKEASIFRLDGDGFVLLYPKANIEKLENLFNQFKEITMAPFTVQGIQINVNFYGAGCVFPEDGEDTNSLLKHLRIVLNIAKNNRVNRFVPYTKEIAESAQRELLLMERLKESVNRQFFGFYLKFQPLVYAESNELYGCEVLLRWSDAVFAEAVSPSEFVPILENMGLMSRVGKWVLQNALHQLSKWTKFKPDMQMNVNVTCAQFEDPEFRFL